MTLQTDPPVDAARETLPPDTPDRGPQDDAYYQGLIDAAANEDEGVADAVAEGETPSTESEPAETPIAAELPPTTEPTPVAPPVTPPVVPNELDQLRQQNAAYEARFQAAAVKERHILLEQETAQLAAQIEAQGVAPETAAQLANQQRQVREEALGAQAQLQGQQAYMQGKMNAALHYGEKHGISAQELMQFESPQAMEMHALGQKKVSALEQEVAALKKSGVPAQTYDGNQASPVAGSTEIRLVESALGKHASERTKPESEALARAAGG
jgi:hypothetical protein